MKPKALALASQRKAELEAAHRIEDAWGQLGEGPLPISTVVPAWTLRNAGLRAHRTQEADASRAARLADFYGATTSGRSAKQA